MENLVTAEIQFSSNELKELDEAISKLTILGDRYIPVELERIQN